GTLLQLSAQPSEFRSSSKLLFSTRLLPGLICAVSSVTFPCASYLVAEDLDAASVVAVSLLSSSNSLVVLLPSGSVSVMGLFLASYVVIVFSFKGLVSVKIFPLLSYVYMVFAVPLTALVLASLV